MSDNSKIEWTDATWNPVRGCTKIRPGCAHCYAETFAERFRGVPGHPFESGFDLRLIAEKLPDPIRWTKPKKIFVNSDLLPFTGQPELEEIRLLRCFCYFPQHAG
jgi:protein gp37